MPGLPTQNDPDLDDFDTISDLSSSLVTAASSLPATPTSSTSQSQSQSPHRLLALRTSSTLSSLAERRKAILRRSVSALEGFPKELSSLIRSSSISRRLSPQRTIGGDDSMNDIQLRPSLDMKLPCSAELDERPSRRTKTKLESRIYNFLTRSRSRSRSKQDSHLASTKQDRMQRPSIDQRRKSEAAHGAKPASRIPSRPLSSTTSTTTNSTATPSTPKASSKRPASGLPTPKTTPTQQQQVRENAAPSSSSRPTTPKSSSITKKTLHNLFSIPLALRRASRSRSRSRPSSPQPSVKSVKDAPPVPSSAWYDDDKTPKARQNVPSPLTARQPSPSRKPKSRASDPPTSSSSALKLPKFLSGRSSTSTATTISGASSLQPRPPSTTALPGSSSLSSSSSKQGTTTSVSGPLKRTTVYRRSVHPEQPHGRSESTSSNGKPVLLPSKTKESPPPSAMRPVSKLPPPSSSSSLSSASRHVSKNASMDASYRYRGGNMSIVEEESSIRTSIRTSLDMNARSAGAPASLKGKAREGTETPTATTTTPTTAAANAVNAANATASHLRPAMKMSAAVRTTKHGSFDFERPGWMMQRTASNGTAISNLSKESGYTAATAPPVMASGEQLHQHHHHHHHPHHQHQQQQQHKERDLRESTFGGPGLAGVGTLQRDMSLKRAKDSEEQVRARERAQRLHEHVQRDKLPPLPPKGAAAANGHGHGHANGYARHHGGSDLSDHNAHSTSTNGTARTGKDSSAGKASGRRMAAAVAAGGGGSRGGSGSGISRLIGTAQHGLFPWEPPVPSPTRSTTTPGDSGSSSRGASTDRSATTRGEDSNSKLKYSGLRGDRPAVPVPTSSIPQRPAGHRGRSLDLGIGLAWAPSKLKEEALMPSSTLFARSVSGASSSVGRSASGSTTGRSGSSSVNGHGHGHADALGHGHGHGSGSGSRSRRVHIQDSMDNPDADRSKMGKEVAELFRNVLDDRGYNAFKTYVRQFDALEIPFDGPKGIVEKVERLLRHAPDRGQDNSELIDKFVRIILQNA